MAKTIVIASGKGGTGKTMLTANLGAMLAMRGHKVVLLDMDNGMRNLDLYLGLENNVVYDINDVLNGMCRIKQALIKDRTFPNLSFMAASPKQDDGEITPLHMKVLCSKLGEVFDYILIDAPAGMDDGFAVSMGGATNVILALTLEYASIRDVETVAMNVKNYGIDSVHYILNKVNVDLMKRGFTPKIEEIPSTIRQNIIGIIQEDENILISTNLGTPVVYVKDTYIYDNFNKIAKKIEEI